MKLSFSTIGCPGWSFKEILTMAKDIGIDGIEVRGIENTLYAPDCVPFLQKNIDSTVEQLRNAKLNIVALDSEAVLGVVNEAEEGEKVAKSYIDLAEKLGVKYVRVMISPYPKADNADLEQCADIYARLCDYGAERGVTPLLETNGLLASSENMLKLLQKVNRENSGVLWDIHHPYRYFNEEMLLTAKTLGSYIKHVHVKDSVMENGTTRYRMMGYGDIPVLDAVKALQSIGYDGCISLEWVKLWNPDLQEPGIVFSHYISYMKYLFAQL